MPVPVSVISGLLDGYTSAHLQKEKAADEKKTRDKMMQWSVLSQIDPSQLSPEQQAAYAQQVDSVISGGAKGKKGGQGGPMSMLMGKLAPMFQKKQGGAQPSQQAQMSAPPAPNGQPGQGDTAPQPGQGSVPMATNPAQAIQGAAPQTITAPPSPTSQSGRGQAQITPPPAPGGIGGLLVAGAPNKVRDAQKMADFDRSQIAPNMQAKADAVAGLADKFNLPAAAKQEMVETALGMPAGVLKAVPKGFKAMEQGGAAFGIEDQDTGKQYLPAQLGPDGDAPPQAKSMWGTIIKQQADKQAAADKKEKDAQDKIDAEDKRQQQRFAHEDARVDRMEQNGYDMADYREQLTTYRTLDTAARQSTSTVDALKDQYATKGDKSAADNQLVNFYTTVVQKGGRKTQAELNLTQKIGSFGMNMKTMVDKAATGELPPDLRKLLLDSMSAVAKEQKTAADAAKPERPTSKGKKSKSKASDGPPSPDGASGSFNWDDHPVAN